jgi:hypothetical protein
MGSLQPAGVGRGCNSPFSRDASALTELRLDPPSLPICCIHRREHGWVSNSPSHAHLQFSIRFHPICVLGLHRPIVSKMHKCVDALRWTRVPARVADEMSDAPSVDRKHRPLRWIPIWMTRQFVAKPQLKALDEIAANWESSAG